MNNEYLNYLNDVLKNLIERALAIKAGSEEFNKGVQFGYYECISHLLNQAEIFDIKENLDQVLQDFDTQSILSKKEENSLKPPDC